MPAGGCAAAAGGACVDAADMTGEAASFDVWEADAADKMDLSVLMGSTVLN